MPKVIGIVGSRRRSEPIDYVALARTLRVYYNKGDRIVSGGCPEGADHFAERIAKDWGVTITIHYPAKGDLESRLLKKNPRIAWAKVNYARNTLIARDCDILIALPAPDRKGGTEDTIRKARKLGKKVVLI